MGMLGRIRLLGLELYPTKVASNVSNQAKVIILGFREKQSPLERTESSDEVRLEKEVIFVLSILQYPFPHGLIKDIFWSCWKIHNCMF